ncbi:MAG: fused MFS/spermidine synthase [Alphaproteobacteria bacterium]|nr:fused MFS/spermidine synthase [Alphaproteobacteria bacterium]
MALEMVASRYLTPYFGGSIFTWAAIISTVLAALAVGYFVGGWIADKLPSTVALSMFIIPSAIYMAFLPFIAPDVSAWIVDAVESLGMGGMVASFTLFFPPLVLLGAISPYVIRLILDTTGQSGTISGRVYGISTAGSIFGTLFTTFYLIPTIGSKSITFALAAVTLLCGLVLYRMGSPPSRIVDQAGRATKIGLALLIGTMVVVSPDRAEAGQESRQVVAAVESPYNSIFVFSEGKYLTMGFGYRRVMYMESRINTADPLELPFQYTRVMTVGLAYPQRVENILMIGLGGGSTTKYIKHFMPDIDFSVVEVDPKVIKLAKQYFGIRESGSYKVIEADGRVFLARNKQAFDIIMLDAYRGWFVPFHLLTREFYSLVKRRLSSEGVVVLNVEPSTMLYNSAIATMADVFENVETFASGGNVVVIGYSGTPKSIEGLRERARLLQNKHGFRYDLRRMLGKRKTAGKADVKKVLTDDFAPANILLGARRHNNPARPR